MYIYTYIYIYPTMLLNFIRVVTSPSWLFSLSSLSSLSYPAVQLSAPAGKFPSNGLVQIMADINGRFAWLDCDGLYR